ncbi:MAG TPA: S8 family serine peptidase [Thermoanaerobaculia bacterium]|nr:S8 family serine peptidase [Thermoanaerobaculia bacterium]
MRMRTLVAVLVLAIAMSLSAAPKNDKSNDRWRAGQVIVKYKAGFAPAADKHGVKSAKKVFAKFKLKGKARQHADSRGLDRVYLLELKKDDVEATVAALKNDPAVEYAEPNWTLSFDAVPNDPSYASQWALPKIGAPAAWNTATSGMGVVIGVVDTGIDLTHPDLAANLWTNPGEIAGNGIDDDDNGFVDDVHGFNFLADTGDPTDTNGHGTRVAGIIGAAGNNATGVSGVVWTARLAALKIGSNPDVYAAVQAIEYANMMGFRITSNSWGWSQGGQSFLLNDVVAAAEAAGYLFVVAAGNEAKDNDVFPTYPSHYANPNVVSVTSTTSSDTLSSYANYGFNSVDLAAPGDSIYTTNAGGGYATSSGTSYATPFVSGAAALYWTANPSLTPAAVRDALMLRSDPLPSLNGRTVSGGRLNVANLFDTDAIAPGAIGDLTVIDATHRSVTIRFTATGDDGASGNATRYDVRVSASPITEASFASATPLVGEPGPQLPGTLELFKLRGIAPSTSYYVAVRAFDNAGNGGALSNVASFTTSRQAIVFDDNVDGGARWTVDGSDGIGGPALWRLAYDSTSGSGAWYYNRSIPNGTNYDTGARNWGALTSREIDLTQARDARLRFRQSVWMELNPNRDLAQVQISAGGGAWTRLLAKQTTVYEVVQEELDLSAYDGQHVRIRFFIDTEDATDNAHPGWMVDDIVIDATSANAPPVASIDALPAIVEDQPATVTITSNDPEGAALEYKWSFGDGTFVYTSSPSLTHTWTREGSYTVSVVAFDGSTSSDPSAVTVVPVPVNDRPIAALEIWAAPPYLEEALISIFPFSSTDEEGPLQQYRFDYGDGTTAIWPRGGPYSDHRWSVPGTYTVTLIVNDGAQDSLPATMSVTIVEAVNDKPVARITSSSSGVHPNETVTFNGTTSSDEETSIASYLWTFPDGTTSTAAAPAKAFGSGAQNVTLVVTDQTGVASTPASTQVRVCGGANAGLFTSPIYTCPGGTARVGVNVQSGILPMTLTWSDGYVQQVTQLINNYYAERVVTPAANTSYALASLTDFLDCAGTVSTTPALVQFASATLQTGTRQICPGQSAIIEPQLTGWGPWTITWSDGYVQTIPINGERRRTVTPAQTTTYSLASATCSDCPSGTTAVVSGSVTVEVNEPLSAVVSGGGMSCNGSGANVTVNIAGGAPPFSIRWSDGRTSSTSSRTYSMPMFPATTTTYTAVVTSGTCTANATGSATITIGTVPTATVSGGGTYCSGGSSRIYVDFTGVGPFTITWSDGTTETVSGSFWRDVAPSTPKWYALSSVSNGCTGTVSGGATVIPSSPVSVTVSGGGAVCPNATTSITAAVSGGTGTYTIVWSDGLTQQFSGTGVTRQVSASTPTTYSVTSVSPASCGTSITGSAPVYPAAAPNAVVSGGGSFCEGASATITATLSGVGPYVLYWSDGFSQSTSSTTVSRQVSPSSATTYTVTVSNQSCNGTSSGSAVVTPTKKPIITTQPQNKTIAKRATTTLTVATTESGLNYQWYQGVSGTTTTPVGTNSATFTTPKLTATTKYWVKIWKSSCASFPTNSATATVTVQ